MAATAIRTIWGLTNPLEQNRMESPVKRMRCKTLIKASILFGIVAFCAAVELRGCMSQHTRPFGNQDLTFDLSPDGKQIVFNPVANGARNLFLLDLNSLRLTRLTDTSDYQTSPAFSPDGRSLVYAAGRPGDRADHLFVRDLDTGRVTQLTSADANDCSPTFSPDGLHIVFTRDTHYNCCGLATSWSGGGAVWSIDRDGSGIRRLLPTNVFATSPHLSPNGKTLLWWDTNGVSIAPADGAGTIRLIAHGGREAVFSPDGDRIAFTAGQYSPDLKIYLLPMTGGPPTLVTQAKGGCFNPVFSPDGKAIYYFTEDDNKYSLWRVGIDGNHPHEVARNKFF